MMPLTLWVKESGGYLMPEAHTLPLPGHSLGTSWAVQGRECASSWSQRECSS